MIDIFMFASSSPLSSIWRQHPTRMSWKSCGNSWLLWKIKRHPVVMFLCALCASLGFWRTLHLWCVKTEHMLCRLNHHTQHFHRTWRFPPLSHFCIPSSCFLLSSCTCWPPEPSMVEFIQSKKHHIHYLVIKNKGVIDGLDDLLLWHSLLCSMCCF